MNKKWNEKTTLEKAMDIISALALFAWMVFEILERQDKFAFAGLASCISICIVCICEAISFWNVKRGLSYVAIAGVVCLIAVIVLQLTWVA